MAADRFMTAGPKTTSFAERDDEAPRLGGLPRWRLRSFSLEQLRALSLVGVLLIIWVVFQVLTHGIFLSPRNLTTLTQQAAITAMLAAGTVMIIVPGYIDLSIGSATGFTGVLAALLIDPARGLGWTGESRHRHRLDDRRRNGDRRLAGRVGGLAARAVVCRDSREFCWLSAARR